ncbi:MAG: TraB/GumN family protein [Proteobacteria bacterium]|nr:TraB/GumN family protein [Pseudomonadota bacterium]
MTRHGRSLAASLVGLLALAWAGAACAFPPVWVVKDKDSEIVLFGSIHILPPGLAWEPPSLEKAIRKADDIWFELPIDAQSEAETARLALQAGQLAPANSLFRMLSADDSALMSKVAQDYDISPVLLDRLKPWLAEITVSAGAYRRVGANADNGVEKTLAAAAGQAERRAFESPAEQIAILARGTDAEQVASLHETLRELVDTPDEYNTLVDAWMAGDMAALDHEALEPLRKSSPDLFRRLVTDRNARWTQVLDQRMKGRGLTVVVVGVGHLIGPGGVPARLRALGYSVTGP